MLTSPILYATTWAASVGNPDQRPSYPAARSTPTVDGDVLYALGSDGDLVCLDIASGSKKWGKSLREDFGGHPGQWAYSESPLVDGDVLVCTPGGKEATIVALNKKTGDLIWKCPSPEGDEAAYSSVIIAHIGDVKQYVQFLQKELVGVEAKTGQAALALRQDGRKEARPIFPLPWPAMTLFTAPPARAAAGW